MDHSDAPPAPELPTVDALATAALPARLPTRPPTYPYETGDIVLPGYRLTRRLGRGGFGEVWRAEAPGGMGVAIKILNNVGRREGGREYRALQTIKNIRHAHIVPLFGVWLKSRDGRLLSDAELVAAEQRILAVSPNAPGPGVEGIEESSDSAFESLELIVAMGLGDQTLYDRLREVQRRKREGLPLEELLPWMQQAALALDHFNSKSRRSAENVRAVQHCDIKPQNILLVGEVVQVCDFGLARAQGEVRATSNNMASLAYAAPEMVSPPNDPSPTTDQYSLALTYIELRTGRLPYTELAPMTILQTKLEGSFDLSNLGAAEARILQRALARDPSKRWPTCTEFIRALRSSLPHGRESGSVEYMKSAGMAPDTDPLSHQKADTPAAPIEKPPAAGDATPASAAPTPLTVDDRRVGTSTNRRVVAATLGLGLAMIAASVAAVTLRGRSSASKAVVQVVADETSRTKDTSTTTQQTGTAAEVAVGATAQSSNGAAARARALEERGDFTGAAAQYSAALDGRSDDLAAVLWSLQTQAADAGRHADCLVLLDQLAGLYAAPRVPRVEGISRWDVVNSLAWYTATRPTATAQDAARAVILAEEALKLAGEDRLTRSHSLDTLAAAMARSGHADRALTVITDAIDLAADAADREAFGRRRDRYRQGLPWNWDDN